MAQLFASFVVLVAALASSRGDVQETAPYKPSGWKPSGPLFLLPPRSEANTLSFNNALPPAAPSDNQFNSPSRPLPPVSPPVFRPTSTSRKPNRKFPDPRNLPAGDTNDDRANTPTQQFTSVAFTQNRPSASAVRQFPETPRSQFAGSDLSDYRNFPDSRNVPADDTNDDRANTPTQQFTSVAFTQNRPSASAVRQFPDAPNSRFADSDLSDYRSFPGPRNFPADDTNDDRANTPTQQFTSVAFTQNRPSASAVRQFPEAPRSQFADSDLSNYRDFPGPRNFPAHDTSDDRAETPTQQFSSITLSENRPPTSADRRFPDAPNSQSADAGLPDYPGDQTDRRSPSSTKLNDDQTFLGNPQPARRPPQAVGEPDVFARDFPPNSASVRGYLPPANGQFIPAGTISSLSAIPTDERPGDLSQYDSPNSPDDYQTPSAVPSSGSNSGYRPVNEYGAPSSSDFGTNSQQRTPRVYFVVLPVRPQETTTKQQVPDLKQITARLLLENLNPQGSQRASPRRRHV